MKHCSIEGCPNKYKAVGYCSTHYNRLTGRHEKQQAYQKKKRAESHYAWDYKYWKTKKGFLVQKYHAMKNRTMGICSPRHRHLYEGLPLLPKEDFYDWSLNSPVFHDLFKDFQASGWDAKLCPSPDRLDSSKGYTLDNMEWVTHSENSRRANLNR